jgi:hypothetical protein
LLRWNRALYEGNLLSTTSKAAFLEAGTRRYGLGIGIEDDDLHKNDKIYSHSGGMPGVDTFLRYETKDEVTITVLGNMDGIESGALARLASIAMRRAESNNPVRFPQDYRALNKPANDFKQLAGIYRAEGGNALAVLVDGDRLLVDPQGGAAKQLIAFADRQFFSPDMVGEVIFDSNKRLIVATPERTVEFVRQESIVPKGMPIYVRGRMNDWGTKDTMRETSTGVYEVTLELEAGITQFKIASEDWRTVDLGAAGFDQSITYGNAKSLSLSGQNITLAVQQAGRYRFTLNTQKLNLTVSTSSER